MQNIVFNKVGKIVTGQNKGWYIIIIYEANYYCIIESPKENFLEDCLGSLNTWKSNLEELNDFLDKWISEIDWIEES